MNGLIHGSVICLSLWRRNKIRNWHFFFCLLLRVPVYFSVISSSKRGLVFNPETSGEHPFLKTSRLLVLLGGKGGRSEGRSKWASVLLFVCKYVGFWWCWAMVCCYLIIVDDDAWSCFCIMRNRRGLIFSGVLFWARFEAHGVCRGFSCI